MRRPIYVLDKDENKNEFSYCILIICIFGLFILMSEFCKIQNFNCQVVNLLNINEYLEDCWIITAKVITPFNTTEIIKSSCEEEDYIELLKKEILPFNISCIYYKCSNKFQII